MPLISGGTLQFKASCFLSKIDECTVEILGLDYLPYQVSSEMFDVFSFCALLNEGCEVEDFNRVQGSFASMLLMVDELESRGLVLRVEAIPSDLKCFMHRWKYQMNYFRKYESSNYSRYDVFRRLRSSRILLLGVGSLGGWCLQHLVASGVENITILDCDYVDESNLARQSFFRSCDVGRSKVQVAKEVVGLLSSHTSIVAIEKRIESPLDISTVVQNMSGCDLVVLTADEPIWQISVWVSQSCCDLSLPLLRGNSLGVGPVVLFGKSPCPACSWPSLQRSIPDIEGHLSSIRTFKGSRPVKAAISTEVAIAGALLADEAIHFLISRSDSVDPRFMNKLRIKNRNGIEIERVLMKRDSSCEVCGGISPS